MSYSPPPRGSGPIKIYQTLKAEILDMSLPPGASLDETGLSQRFDMSRTPVREALARLVQEGLATTLPNRNTIVSAIDFGRVPHYLDALTLMYRVTGRLAAERRQARDLQTMRTLQTKFVAAVEARDVMAMLTSNRDLHFAIAVAGHNSYYQDLTGRLLDEGLRLLRLYYRTFDDQLPQEYAAEHDAIIAAIEARDVSLSDRLAIAHADQIVRQLQRFLEPGEGLPL
ncbi:MAG: GntR family transcriptional regulator [Ancalomicrobiaceae bacterium]|nr:GntR family transcriptional regulator [Ancalomicrobiaceae bacterium]